MKPFVAAAVLQLVERGRFTLDDALTDVLPADVTDRFPNASKITVRMLLDHRSGLPEWDSPAVDVAAVRHPGRVWKVSDFLDLAAAKKPVFQPGTRYKYWNTDYTLLGLIIEHATGRSWRQEVTDRRIGRHQDAHRGPSRRYATSDICGPHAGSVDCVLIDITPPREPEVAQSPAGRRPDGPA